MSAYRLTPDAIDDLDEIWAYIARDSTEAADRVELEIFAACERRSLYPANLSLRSRLRISVGHLQPVTEP